MDLLVETGARTSAWFAGALVADLEDLLGRRVDVVTELRERVLREAIPV